MAGGGARAGAAGAPSEAALAWAEDARERGAVVLFDHETIEGAYDLCIASPGISENAPFYRSALAASAEVISEVEFAWRESDASSKWVAITGTNGKTTTTALTCHLLREAGMNAAAVGNIGETCIDAGAAGNTDVYVAETSSYQLASTRLFAPDVAVVLNITPDHLSWHGSLEAYAAAKWKVLANLGVSGGVAVLDACDDAVRAKIRELRARGGVPFRYIPIGGASGLGADMRATCGTGAAAFRGDGGQLVVAGDGRVSDLVFVDDLQIKGGHNQQNALAAAAADYAGITIDFEGMKSADWRAPFVAFLTRLRAALPADKTLYVCVPPDDWYKGYDYRGIGEVCDKVILMAHDYQWTSVPDGYVGVRAPDSPVTPFSSIFRALSSITDAATGVQDRSKIALAISFGTAGFQVDGNGLLASQTIYHPAQATIARRLAQPDTVITYDGSDRNPCAVYTGDDGTVRYQLWYEDARSVTDKIELARMFGVNGVSLWRVGNIPSYAEDAALYYDVWPAILAQRP